MKMFAKILGTRGRRLCVIALVAVIGFAMAACGDVDNPTGGDENGGENITATPQTVEYSGQKADGTKYSLTITENTARYAAQTGDSYVLIMIKTDGTTKTSSGTVKNAGAAILILLPTGAEATFEVTISGTDIIKISGTITFNETDNSEQIENETDLFPIDVTLPESKPVAERWVSWATEDTDNTTTITHSVASDGVCTITVGGTAATNNEWWGRTTAAYEYTGRAGATYKYTFEAWTQSGNRDLIVQYYNNWGFPDEEDIYKSEKISITTDRKAYTITGEELPHNSNFLDFQCANQLGTFYVKMLEIKEYTIDSLSVAERWWSWADDSSKAKITHSVDGNEVCTVNVTGSPEPDLDAWKVKAGYKYTIQAGKAYKYTFEAKTESGTRDLSIDYYNDDEGWLWVGVPITDKWETYTVLGEPVPKGGDCNVIFKCADQIGTFYIKMLEIKETS